MPMNVYMDVNHFSVNKSAPHEEYKQYTLVLKVGNGATVFAKFHPSVFKNLKEEINKTEI